MFYYKQVKRLRLGSSIFALAMGFSWALAGETSMNDAPCSSQVTAKYTENNAAQQLRNPCYLESTELPEEIKNQLKINAGFGWGIFNGNIYNGNSEYVITRLVISMEPIYDGHHMEMMGHISHEPKIHQISLNLAPLTQGALSMALHEKDAHIHDFKWEIIKVFGHKRKI